ncbi:MAG: ComEC/Rec2 family competence protein [Planctomycetaceae bacterium]
MSADIPALEPARHRGRHPAVFVATAIAAGILIDVWWPMAWSIWLAALAGLLVVWGVLFRIRPGRVSTAFVLAAIVCLGGARYHQVRSAVDANDVSRFGRDESIPVRLTGRVVSSPVIVPRREDPALSAWLRPDRSFVLLECESLRTNEGHADVTGVVRVQVAGHLLHVEPGDRVEAHGWMVQPGGPQNPGQYDFRDRLARDGVRCLLYVDDPDAVKRIERPAWSPGRSIGRLRSAAEELLVRNLRGRSSAVGSAILLGDRTQIDDELRESFIQSGMMHLLAISGLHVGILAAFVWLTLRACGFSEKTMAVVVIGVLVGYALMTDIRPSIVRATIVISVLTVGSALNRRVSPLNALGVAAAGILLWNPLDLFHVGAQLSFLAVLGMIVAHTWSAGRPIRDPAAESPSRRRHVVNGLRWGGWWVKRMYVAMAGIWLFAAPLVAARFHVVSPAGLLVNLVLIPWFGVVLWCGYLLVFGGLLVPPLEGVAAALFDVALKVMLFVVDWASGLRLGHYYVAGPADWWLVVYYGLLSTVLFVPVGRWRRVSWVGVGGWLVAGLAVGLTPVKQDGLRCTILSMGHGVAVLVEAPNGKTLLYDAGSFGNSNRATATVQSALWARRRSRLDAIVVSHADIDHFNGVPGLLKTVPVGTLFCAKSFLDFKQPAVVITRDTAELRGVPVRLLRAGDALQLDPDVRVRILHPSLRRFENDNANSVVLEITYAGRRILLTGDLERDGMDRVLGLKPRHVDVMLSPHHGSPAANPAELADWATPTYVVASGGRRVKLEALRRTYAKSKRVFSTYRDGAITVEISPDGEVRVTPFVRR